MEETFTNVLYSQHVKGNNEVSKQIKYDISRIENDVVMSTSYTKKIDGDLVSESFNRLCKNKEDTYQQIGNSHNKNDWQIKEFHGDNMMKEYNDSYKNHIFDENILDDSRFFIDSIDKKYITSGK